MNPANHPPLPPPPGAIAPMEIAAVVLALVLLAGVVILLYVRYRGAIARKTEELQAELDRRLEEGAHHRTHAVTRLRRLNDLTDSLQSAASLPERLKAMTDSLAATFDADICRIWLVRPGDLCEKGCVHAQYADGPHACHDRTRCLHLMASSGPHARTDSRMHNRVPFGCYKIGRVGAGQDRKFLTNDIASDRRVPNPQWAAQMGLVSFAGYKLALPDGDPIGVLAFFARAPVTSEEDAMLENIANSVSEAIQKARAEQALRESEAKFRTLYEASSDAVLVLDKGRFVDCNASALAMLGYPRREELLGRHLHEFCAPPDAGQPTHDENVNACLTEALSRGSHRCERLLVRRDGGSFPADILFTAMQVGDRTVVQAVARDITERRKAEAEREALIAELQDALAKIKTLRGLLPICANCKKVRDDKGYWNQIEVYVHDHSDAEFSHSICPECMKELYPEHYARKHERGPE